MNFLATSSRRNQNGAALVVVLLLLLVMTWMGVSSMRGTMLGERMSGAVYDRSLAFQGGETALREAENWLATKPVFPAAGCAGGLCAQRSDLLATEQVRWEDATTPWRNATDVLDVDSDGDGTVITTTPQYVIEAMGVAPNWPGCDREIPINPKCVSPRFRVTARSNEVNRAQVLLQSSVSAF